MVRSCLNLSVERTPGGLLIAVKGHREVVPLGMLFRQVQLTIEPRLYGSEAFRDVDELFFSSLWSTLRSAISDIAVVMLEGSLVYSRLKSLSGNSICSSWRAVGDSGPRRTWQSQ